MNIRTLKENFEKFLEEAPVEYAYSIGIPIDKLKDSVELLKQNGLFVDNRDKIQQGNPISSISFEPPVEELDVHRQKVNQLLGDKIHSGAGYSRGKHETNPAFVDKTGAV